MNKVKSFDLNGGFGSYLFYCLQFASCLGYSFWVYEIDTSKCLLMINVALWKGCALELTKKLCARLFAKILIQNFLQY